MTTFPILDCGDHNHLVGFALEYLPGEVLEEHKEKLAIMSMAHRDGARLTRSFCKDREIILLSERILPKSGDGEGDSGFRYFVYVVLHEVAHAIRNHGSPLLDGLTREENEAQEAEARALAVQWFNDHIRALNNPYLQPLTGDEIDQMEQRTRDEKERSKRIKPND